MSTVIAFFLGCGLGGLVAGVVVTYAVATCMPEKWRRR